MDVKQPDGCASGCFASASLMVMTESIANRLSCDIISLSMIEQNNTVLHTNDSCIERLLRMKCFSLNGEWLYRVGYGTFSPITVPFSHLPVGRSECVRSFDLPEQAERIFLKLDGITYDAVVLLNGAELGRMLPYCEYEFEITGLVKERGNELRVILEDIDRAFGPSEGWENYGGIIRDVHLILREKSYLRNAFFKAQPLEDFQKAQIEVEVDAICEPDARVMISLLDGEKTVCAYAQSAGETVRKVISGIRLWSPETPECYSLEVRLVSGGQTVDLYSCTVGFRFLSHDRHRFILNGKPLFLKGVCKHEMVGSSGHCPTPAQMENDLRMIKKMGCNFVRLVHYPHNKQILELADRIGLLVSEEPGLWWSDTADPVVAEGSKEVLRRTILRDRNHPCIAFWLCFNECRFTERFLIDSARICRENDPTRMVSGANCMSDEETLLYYNKCQFDFYTMHPYANTFARAQRSAEMLHDKPLLFTEWGGYHVYNNPHLLLDFMTEMNRLYRSNHDSGALAGAFFWFFAELNDFNRGEPACTDGVLHEGLVDENRNPTLIYDAFCRGLTLFDQEEPEQGADFWFEPEDAAARLADSRQLVAAQQSEKEPFMKRIHAECETNGCMRKRKIKHGPILPEDTLLSAIPHAAAPGHPLIFECGEKAQRITVIGLTMPQNGYPLGGVYGEKAGEMTIVYKNGHRQSIGLQNGVHLTTVYALNGSSRINPVAEKAERFASFGYDRNFEVYVMNRLDIETELDEIVQRVEFAAEDERYAPMVYGVFAK